MFPLRVAFHTFGCRSNYADTVDLETALAENGVIACEFHAEADVYVVNTCTVTDDADKSALRLIRKAKEKSPHAKIVVTGCMAEVNSEAIESLKAADVIVGPGRKNEVVESILGMFGQRSFEAKVTNRSLSMVTPGPGELLGEVKSRSRFHLRVQEGCENSCTFCIIPRARGSLSSVPPQKILEDLKLLAEKGYREVVLTGTHLGGYGEDSGSSLLELVEMLAEKSPIQRIRLSSLDPNDVSKNLIEALAFSHVFCNHLHICIQAFSNSTLKRMNRRYRMKDVFELFEYLKETWPGCAVGSDLIVGFPGESRQDVDQGIETFLGLPISYLHVFPYSERSGTPAAEFGATHLGGVIEIEERRRRAARFRSLSERRRIDFYRTLIGSTLEIVVEARDSDSHSSRDADDICGTSREFAAVRVIRGERPSSNIEAKPGSLLTVRAESVDETGGEILCSFLDQGK